MRVKYFDFPGKIRRMFKCNWRFQGVLLTTPPLMGSRAEAHASLSYTAFRQALNSLCEQEGQVLSIIKPISIT